MAEAAAVSAVGKIAGCWIEPIQRELGYLFCFNTIIQELETQRNQLTAMRNDVQAREDAEQRSWKTLGEAANLWMFQANGKIAEAETIFTDKAQLQNGCFSIKWCPNLRLRFSLGRKGKKLSLVLNALLQSGRHYLPQTGLPLPMPPINMRDYNGDPCDLDSRRKPMEDMIELLQDKETRLIGICGMGGIGKTTFAKQLLQKVNDSHNHLFDFQVISTVSSYPNLNNIQQEVVEMLGGSSLREIKNEMVRAELLRNAFSNKKVVVLLDDVWEEFDLSTTGFPLMDVGYCCKIIYTSRNKNLWVGQSITKKEISLDVLSDEEAWSLFRRKVVLHDDDIDFHSKNEIARKIVKECGQLPLALEAVGGALIEKILPEWNVMLLRLQNHHQDGHKDKIHKVLETSYHFLEDPNAKFLFLLCCLFQEDEQIHIETLYHYAIGLQLFKSKNDLEYIRDNVCTIVENLIRRNLLIKVAALSGRERVKMHDMVRYVGISIAKQQENGLSFLMCDDENVLENVIGQHDKITSVLLPKNYKKVLDSMEFKGSKLELLRLDSSRIYPSYTEISGNFLGADNLKVLDIVDGMISDFPDSSSFLNLAKLKMLSLEKLKITTNISFIQHLSCLEVLSLRWSTIEYFPTEVGELTNLRLLDLTWCNCFIRRGVLLKLTNLQELYMWGSFNQWSALGGEHDSAEFEELYFLRKLRRVELEIPSIAKVPREVKLFSSSTLLKQFKIRIGRRGSGINFESGERQLWLENDGSHDSLFYELGFLIEKGITNLSLCKNSHLWKKMHFRFFSLKDVVLEQCESLFPQSQSSPQIEFGRYLRRIEIYEGQMRHLCSTSITRRLQNLQVLVLVKCKMMEEVVNSCDETNQLRKIEFNALEILKICDMGMLECFCKGINEIQFLRLQSLKLKGLQQFVFPSKLEIPCLEELSIKSLPNIENLCSIVAPSLKKLKIVNCDSIIFVFSKSFTMESISNLKTLTIKNCKMLEGVVGVSKGIEEQGNESIQFPNLTTLHLVHLNQLSSFVVAIENLNNDSKEPQLQTLFQHDDQLSFPCLRKLRILGLSKINYIVGWKNRDHHHDDKRHQQPTLSPLFPILRKLEVDNLSNLIHFYENNRLGLGPGVFLFENLTYLDIARCDEMRYLFSENIARVATKHLEHLYIRECPMMEVVMKNVELEEDGDKAGRGEGEGIVSLPNIHFFPFLETLTLSGLRALTSFCDLAYGLALPSLNLLSVLNCPKLKLLSPGHLYSPRLLNFRHDDHDITKMAEIWKGDINSTLIYQEQRTSRDGSGMKMMN